MERRQPNLADIIDQTSPGIGRGSPFGRAAGTVLRRTREAKLKKLRELFKQALTYDAARRASSEGPTNPRLEALALPPWAQHGVAPPCIRSETIDVTNRPQSGFFHAALSNSPKTTSISKSLPLLRLRAEVFSKINGADVC